VRLSAYIPRPGEYPDEAPDTTADVARTLEELRYDAVAVSDHPFPVVAGRGHQAHDPFVSLALAAAATTRLKLQLGLAVAPYRSPFVLARAVSTLQYASRGRVILGIGSGYLDQEFAALGASFADKRAYTTATLRALRLAFSGEPVHDETPWWHAAGNEQHPRVEHPVPVWFGGNTRWALEQAVLNCDGWAPHEVTAEQGARLKTVQVAGVDGLRDRIRLLDELRALHGRTAPLEICFTRNTPAWRAKPRAEVLEELHEMRELGVSWLCVRFRPDTVAELRDELAWFRDVVDEFAAVAR
jgi:probable F420-dependent oxidoreductase